MSIPTTSKAWTFSSGGLPRSTLTLNSSHPIPPFPPAANEDEEHLLISVAYAALNPADLLNMAVMPEAVRSGRARTAAVPGNDFSGTVLAIFRPLSQSSTPTSSSSSPGTETGTGTGTGTDKSEEPPRFSPGTLVVCFSPFSQMRVHASGGLQSVVSLPARYAVPLPLPLSPSSSSSSTSVPTNININETLRAPTGLLLTGCTALQQVRETSLSPGQRVLVYGASGGIGTMALQLARHAVGPTGFVVAISSERNLQLLRELGADEVLDYTSFHSTIELAKELARRYGNGSGSGSGSDENTDTNTDNDDDNKMFNVVLDTYGSQELYNACAGFLKRGGMYDAAGIHYGEYALWPVLKSGLTLLWNAVRPQSPWLGGAGRTWKAVSMMDPPLEMMEELVRLFGEGKIRVVVDSEWPFDKVLDAYDVLLSGRARGKILIKVADH